MVQWTLLPAMLRKILPGAGHALSWQLGLGVLAVAVVLVLHSATQRAELRVLRAIAACWGGRQVATDEQVATWAWGSAATCLGQSAPSQTPGQTPWLGLEKKGIGLEQGKLLLFSVFELR